MVKPGRSATCPANPAHPPRQAGLFALFGIFLLTLVACATTPPPVIPSAPSNSVINPVINPDKKGNVAITASAGYLGNAATCMVLRGKQISSPGIEASDFMSIAVDGEHFIVNGKVHDQKQLSFFCPGGIDFGGKGNAPAILIKKEAKGFSAWYVSSLPFALAMSGEFTAPSINDSKSRGLRVLLENPGDFQATVKVLDFDDKGLAVQKYVSIVADGGVLVLNGKIQANHSICFNSLDPIVFRGISYVGLISLYYDAQHRLFLNNILDMESYLRCVVPHEMFTSWNIEALKAQAVIARTYALRAAEKAKKAGWNFDVFDDTRSQAYGGEQVRDPRTDEAVAATAGEVILQDGKLIEAFFHANSGGKLEDGEYLLNRKVPYLVAMDDPFFQAGDAQSAWTKTAPAAKLLASLHKPNSTLKSITVAQSTKPGRAQSLDVTLVTNGTNETIRVPTADFKPVFGGLLSELFTIALADDTITVTGGGFGHGVGMPQRSAANAATAGKNYREIIKIYYPGTEVKKLP